MPTVKPNEERVALLKDPSCVSSGGQLDPQPNLNCQDFYEEQLSDGFREDRFWELSKKEGVPYTRFAKAMQEKKVRPPNSGHLTITNFFRVK